MTSSIFFVNSHGLVPSGLRPYTDLFIGRTSTEMIHPSHQLSQEKKLHPSLMLLQICQKKSALATRLILNDGTETVSTVQCFDGLIRLIDTCRELSQIAIITDYIITIAITFELVRDIVVHVEAAILGSVSSKASSKEKITELWQGERVNQSGGGSADHDAVGQLGHRAARFPTSKGCALPHSANHQVEGTEQHEDQVG